MKIVIVSFLCLVLCFRLCGQKAAVLYYDSIWQLTVKESADYYRVAVIDTSDLTFYGEIKDYYTTGKLQMKGTYYRNIKIDTFEVFYENGRLKEKGRYLDNVRSDEWNYYYPNGQLKQKLNFSPYDFQVLEYFDTLGNSLFQDGTGNWTNQYCLPKSKVCVQINGKYKNFKKHGTWTTYSIVNGLLKTKDHQDLFKKGELMSNWYSGNFITAYFPDSYKLSTTEQFRASNLVSRSDYPFIKLLPEEVDSLKLPYDEDAKFVGGYKALNSHLKGILYYPSTARDKGITGLVLVEFIIDKSGNTIDVRVPESIHSPQNVTYGFNDQVKKAIKSFPKWLPALRNQAPVMQKRAFFIQFGKSKAPRRIFENLEGASIFYIE